MPTWDETKRKKNIRDHKIDFVGCETIFDSPIAVLEDDRDEYGELRLNAVGWINFPAPRGGVFAASHHSSLRSPNLKIAASGGEYTRSDLKVWSYI